MFCPPNTLIYGISCDGSKKFNIRTCEHMIPGQLRIWARTTTSAALAVVTKSWTKCGPSCIFPLSHTKDPKVSDTHCKTLCRRPEWENSEANMLLCRKRGKKGVIPSFALHEHLTTKWKAWTQRNSKTTLPERSTNWDFWMLIPTIDWQRHPTFLR